jgi:uncharacterized NAD(P)/FAD-binding protein YdhS
MDFTKKVKTIAVIGGGFSGTMLAVNLLNQAPGAVRVIMIEKEPVTGKGVAYSTEDATHLLNVPAAKMSAFPDDPGHFIHWLEKNQAAREFNLEISPDSFLPRKIYGLYLQDILNEVTGRHGSSLERIYSEAVALDLTGKGAVIFCKNEVSPGNFSVSADKAVLALGNYPPGNLPVADEAFYKSSNYFQDPWGKGVLRSLAKDSPVLLIGSGLTMVDLVLSLKESGHQGKIYVISKHGYLPLAHSKAPSYPSFISEENLPGSFPGLFRLIRRQVESAREQGIDWRAVIDSLRPYSQKIWQALSVNERKKFMRYARHRWGVLRHRLPPQTAKIFNELAGSGQVEVYGGTIKGFSETGNEIKVKFKPGGQEQLKEIKVSRVINCTGPEPDITRINQAIIVDLLNKGLIRPDPLRLGLDATPEGAVIGSTGQPSSVLFTLGPLLKGILWESTAVPELRVQALDLAELLLQD